MIHMINDTYDSSFTRVTRKTFEKWLSRSVGVVEIIHTDSYSEYFRCDNLIAFTTPLLTI